MHWFFNGLLVLVLGSIGCAAALLLCYFGWWLLERTVDREDRKRTWRE